MNRYDIISTSLLCISLLAGCSNDQHKSTSKQIGDTTRQANAAQGPCAIAIAPHSGEGRIDQTIIRYQQQVRDAARPVAYLERLGWAFVAKARASFDPGFYKLAEQSALCIETKKPGSAEAQLLRGHVLHQLHRFREAEELAYELVKWRGRWFDYGLWGDALMEQGKLDEAVVAYQMMMDQKPGPQAYSRAAHIRWLKGDQAGAIELMQMAAAAIGTRNPETAAWLNVRLADYQLYLGQVTQARERIAVALAVQSEYPPALLVRGRLLLMDGNPDKGISVLKRAAELNPIVEYQWSLIEALRTVGRTNEASTVEKQLIRHGATVDRRTFALYLASTRQDLDTALQLARQELQVRADIFTLDTMAWTLNAAGRYNEARSYSRQALAEGTQDARLFYHAGVIASAVGEDSEAARWLKRATALQHMLLPSEQAHLAKESARQFAQPSVLASTRRHTHRPY